MKDGATTCCVKNGCEIYNGVQLSSAMHGVCCNTAMPIAEESGKQAVTSLTRK